MSILELIARRSRLNAAAFSLPELLAEQALSQLPRKQRPAVHRLLVEHLGHRLLEDEPAPAADYVATLLSHGMDLDRLVCSILTETAVYLGDCWVNDALTFTEVTHAMGNLMQVTRDVTAIVPGAPQPAPSAPRILLVRTPGEDHFYGMTVAAYRLRASGALVRLDFSGDVAEICLTATSQDFDAIGFSVGSDVSEPALGDTISKVRKATPDAMILVGGAAIERDRDMAQRAGADHAIVSDDELKDLFPDHFHPVEFWSIAR